MFDRKCREMGVGNEVGTGLGTKEKTMKDLPMARTGGDDCHDGDRDPRLNDRRGAFDGEGMREDSGMS